MEHDISISCDTCLKKDKICFDQNDCAGYSFAGEKSPWHIKDGKVFSTYQSQNIIVNDPIFRL